MQRKRRKEEARYHLEEGGCITMNGKVRQVMLLWMKGGGEHQLGGLRLNLIPRCKGLKGVGEVQKGL